MIDWRSLLSPTAMGISAVLAMPLLAQAADTPSAPARRPNIVFILSDDIGYGDLGCYGATAVKTPNVDKLAKDGIRFTNAYAPASICTPSRYAFLTGGYAFRNPAATRILSGEAPLAIDTASTTVPSLLRQGGYATGLVGKWHIGLGKGDLDYNQKIAPGPLEVGFDHAFYFPATGDRVPCVFIENHHVVGLDPKDPIRVSYVEKMGDEPTGKEHPELLKVKSSRGHEDTIVNGISRIGWVSGGKEAWWKDEDVADTLAKNAVAFLERNAAAKVPARTADGKPVKPFFLYLATHDIHVPRVPHSRYKGKSGCGVRGDAIEQFDGTVGTVLTALDRLGLADDTLVVVSSDNGGALEDGYADGAVADANGHHCNGVLRGNKGSLWEGGSRVPFVARWPGQIKPGTTSDELISLVDMMSTFGAAAGQTMPPAAGPDSFNMLPALLGQTRGTPGREHLVMQAAGVSALAIRSGNWKLIPAGATGWRDKDDDPTAKGPQLFNLVEDAAEKQNVAALHPDKVRELEALLLKDRKSTRTRPD